MNKLCIYVTIALALASVITAEVIINTKCDGNRERNTQSVVDEIVVTPCVDATGESSSPCRLERGTNATITVKFTPSIKSRRLKATLSWRNGVADLPFRGMKSNACQSMSNGRCPTTINQSHTWTAVVPLANSLPTNQYPLKLKIMDGSKFIVCQIFAIKLV